MFFLFYFFFKGRMCLLKDFFSGLVCFLSKIFLDEHVVFAWYFKAFISKPFENLHQKPFKEKTANYKGTIKNQYKKSRFIRLHSFPSSRGPGDMIKIRNNVAGNSAVDGRVSWPGLLTKE